MAITLNGTSITMNDASTITSTTTYGAIGSYALWWNRSSAIAIGGTVAGSSLSSTTTNSTHRNNLNQDGGFVAGNNVEAGPFGIAMNTGSAGQHSAITGLATGSGTWRSMMNSGVGGNQHSIDGEGGQQQNRAPGGLFTRIS